MIAAGKGKIKIRGTMRMVGFTPVQVEMMKLYQRVRRKSMQMVVVDKSSVATPGMIAGGPVPQVHLGSGETVTSTLQCLE